VSTIAFKLNWNHSLKAPGFNRCFQQAISWFQTLLSNVACAATAGRVQELAAEIFDDELIIGGAS
jgi:hypothetical protein